MWSLNTRIDIRLLFRTLAVEHLKVAPWLAISKKLLLIMNQIDGLKIVNENTLAYFTAKKSFITSTHGHNFHEDDSTRKTFYSNLI